MSAAGLCLCAHRHVIGTFSLAFHLETSTALLFLFSQLKTWSWGSRGWGKMEVTQAEKKRVRVKVCPFSPPRAPLRLLVSVSWNSLLPKKNTHLQDKLMILNLQRRNAALAREGAYFT